MKIGFDAKRAAHNNTGLGNYSRYAIDVLSQAYPDAQLKLYTPSTPKSDRIDPLLERSNVELFNKNASNGLTAAFWRSFDLPLQLRQDGIDLFHGLSNELPLTIKDICPSVVTIHDVIYRRHPEGYMAIDRKLYDYKYGRSAHNASRVIAISECTKRDIIDIYNIDPAKIDVIYQGIDPIFSLPVDTIRKQEVRAKYHLPEKYIIAVGTVEARKNQMLAVHALKHLPQGIKLVIVGRMTSKYADSVRREIERLGLSDRVMHLENVPFLDLPALYACAEIASYTSRYEGFGLPVVEAIASGTPVLAATGSCLEEAGGQGAVYLNPDDPESYAREAMHLIDDVVFRDKTLRLGRRHIARFTPEEFARRTMASYNKAITGL